MTSQGNQTIADYFTKLKTLWAELENYQTVRLVPIARAKQKNLFPEPRLGPGLDSAVLDPDLVRPGPGLISKIRTRLQPVPGLGHEY